MKKFTKHKFAVATNRKNLIVGMDISDRVSTLAILDDDEITFDSVANTRSALDDRFASLDPCRVICEAGTHSPWMSRHLSKMGHEVIVANPRKLQLITKNLRKSDTRDAEVLARLAKASPRLLSPICHRGEQAQLGLALLRVRDGLVQCRTALVNQARGIAKSLGFRLPPCDAANFALRAGEALDAMLAPLLKPMLATLATLAGQIASLDRQIEQLSQETPAAKCVRQIHGIGPITSLCYVLTIDDPRRFARSREIGPYLGLAPARNQSGERDPEMHITKAGDTMLRRLLVNCAQSVLRKSAEDSTLKRFGQRLAARGGKAAKKKAVVAVARKLAVLMHRLWVTGEVYEPLRGSPA